MSVIQMGRAFSPGLFSVRLSQAAGLGWYGSGPLALIVMGHSGSQAGAWGGMGTGFWPFDTDIFRSSQDRHHDDIGLWPFGVSAKGAFRCQPFRWVGLSALVYFLSVYPRPLAWAGMAAGLWP